MTAIFKAVAVRFMLPLLVLTAGTAFVLVPLIDRLLSDWFRGDVELRAGVIATSMDETVSRLLSQTPQSALTDYLDRVSTDERLVAVLLCGADGSSLAASRNAPAWLNCSARAALLEARRSTTGSDSLLLSDFPLGTAEPPGTTLRLVHDLRYAERRRAAVRDNLLVFSVAGILALSVLFGVGASWSFRRWSDALLNDIRGGRLDSAGQTPSSLTPVLDQVRKLVRDIEENQRIEIEYGENYTPVALQHIVRDALGSPDILVVSNREPYIHNYLSDGTIGMQFPASGMVTALEPVMRACSGTWIAHGSGTADRAVVDRAGCVAVPPDQPSYRLRRVWLTPEEELGYYYGFSNEGLWPLCHLAYVRPEFRSDDWRAYLAVNEKFARVVDEQSRNERPVVLIQDFHFAPLPKLIRARKPQSTIMVFWHIPWPNAETFGVCPWKLELLQGLLDADILGFHTRAHCLNFLSTVDRYLEAQIDYEHMTVTTLGHTCRIAAYPISIEWPPRWQAMAVPIDQCRDAIRKRFNVPPSAALALGVERWDFTKGILERLISLEILLERRPDLHEKITLLQIAAPTRSKLPAYQQLQERTHSEAARINQRFARHGWLPIVLVPEHQDAEQVCELYRGADICLVNSLHDGMNLVAKEFVAARDDEDGVLILSTFAGASRELLEALLVNPFDATGTADAIESALAMQHDERRERMNIMRRTVKVNNVYRWAGKMLIDAAHVRQRQRLEELSTQAINSGRPNAQRKAS